jgi:hypothetical protein
MGEHKHKKYACFLCKAEYQHQAGEARHRLKSCARFKQWAECGGVHALGAGFERVKLREVIMANLRCPVKGFYACMAKLFCDADKQRNMSVRVTAGGKVAAVRTLTSTSDAGCLWDWRVTNDVEGEVVPLVVTETLREVRATLNELLSPEGGLSCKRQRQLQAKDWASELARFDVHEEGPLKPWDRQSVINLLVQGTSAVFPHYIITVTTTDHPQKQEHPTPTTNISD